jgi:hypothetical protein
MSTTTQDLEAKLLEILNQPDKSDSLAEAIELVADKEEGKLTDEQRATLASLLEAGLPSPDQIVRDAKCAEHNAKIEQARKLDLARRMERRAKNPKRRRK